MQQVEQGQIEAHNIVQTEKIYVEELTQKLVKTSET